MKTYMFENKHYKSLNILTLGHDACKPLHSFSYAYTDFYLIHYVLKGCGTFLKNNVAKKVYPGEIFIIKPENTYEYTADEENPWEYIWFSFDGELSSLFENLDDIIKVDSSAVLDMLHVDFLKNTRTEFLTGKLYEFISELLESVPASNNYVKTVSDYVKANYMNKLPIQDIATQINLNPRYLSRIFKAEKGISLQNYILKYKMNKAKELLKKGFNVSETAKMVGYDDPFTFSKAFKKQLGISPSKV